MSDNSYIKNLIKEHVGSFILVEELELIVPFEKQTLYKKFKKYPESNFKKNNGYIIVDVEIFLDSLFLSENS